MTNGWPPVFATNRPELDERVADQINALFEGVRQHAAEPPNIAIATAYINAAGFTLLADELEQAPRVRLLLGAEPDPTLSQRLVPPIGRAELVKAVSDHESWIQRARDLTGFTKDEDAAAKRLVEWLASRDGDDSPRVKVRRYTDGFLHGKAYIADHPVFPHTLAGSSNFTAAGLTRNVELNLGYPNSEYTKLVQEWFEWYWERSTDFDLASLYEERWSPHSPWIVFLRMLWELYGAFDEGSDESLFQLFGYQREGVARMLRILDEHNGVIVADEVGLGKTYMAAEVMKRAAERDRQRVLVLTPAALKTGMWEPFLTQHLPTRRVAVLSYEEFRNRWDSEDGDVRAEFRNEMDEYALVVIDEAHNLRNAAAKRSAAVSALIGGANPKRLVLLTATPVNNSLEDLHVLVRYFIRNDARFAEIGIPSIREYIRRAMELDQDNLSPEHLFDLIDQVAVRRTRKFIKEHYAGESALSDDGSPLVISFPDVKLERLDYEFDEKGEALVDAMVYALDTEGDDKDYRYESRQQDPGRLLLARYLPSSYSADGTPADLYQITNTGLLKSALLKRLESSPAALAATLERLIGAHESFLSALEHGKVIVGEALREWTNSGDDDFDQFLQGLDDAREWSIEDANDFHADELKRDVEEDLELLRRLKGLADEANEGVDAKAARLVERLRDIAAEARRPAASGVSQGDRRKTIVFSSFTDTIEDVHKIVQAAVGAASDDDPLSDFKERIAPSVIGSRSASGQEQKARVLARFAPRTAGRENSEDKYDLLLTTDVLSEGVNLQQAGRVINYDLPWNPMRVVQRHGRVDRIGSAHPYVYLDCFFPADHLDQLLELEARLHRKLAQADAALGVGQVIPGFTGSQGRVFAETEQEIRKLADENPELLLARGDATALSGEEYRKRLAKATEHDDEFSLAMKRLPYGSGSGFVSERNGQGGYVFCARLDGVERPVFRFVPADDQWRIVTEDDDDGKPRVSMSRETLRALSTADPGGPGAKRDLPDEAYEAAFVAWAAAKGDIVAERDLLADPQTLRPRIPKPMRDAANLVADHGGFLGEQQSVLNKRLSIVPPHAVQAAVREVLRDAALTPRQMIERIGDVADEEGLEVPPPPPEIDPVHPAEVHLVAWMAVRPQGMGDSA